MPKTKKPNLPTLERRSYRFDVRAEKTEQGTAILTGRPVVYSSPTDICGEFEETIEPGALDGANLTDVRFLVNHDTSMIPLARSRNNNENSTMQLTVNERGMDIRVDLDAENNAEAKALYSAVNRGDMTGMSFMFFVDKDSWEDIDSDYPKRTIEHIRKVLEVSAVAFPAYPGTSIQAASQDAMLDSVRASLESARKRAAEERAKQADAERRTAALNRLNNLIKEVKQDGV